MSDEPIEPLTALTPQGPGAPLWREKFIGVLKETHSVTAACAAIDRSRAIAYVHRHADKDFAALWDEATETSTDTLEATAMQRAIDGWDEPVWYQGDMCGEVRKFDNHLLMRLLAARRRSVYGEKREVTLDGEITTKRVVFGGSEGGGDE